MTPAHRLAARAVATILGSALAVGGLAGCGGSDDDADRDDPTPAPSATESTSDGATPAGAGYLPVPDGVVLTEPGAALGLGEEATVAWRPRQDRVVALDLTVDRIDRTTFKESFEGWVVTPEMKGQVPYFTRVTATNVGTEPVGDLLVPLYGLVGTQSMYEPLDFRQEVFEPCPGGMLPAKLKSGASTELCFVYLVPDGQDLTAAAFDVVGELPPVTWSGPITEIEKPKKDRDKKRKNDRSSADEDAEQAG